MNRLKLLMLLHIGFLSFFFPSCTKDDENDMEKPIINMNFDGASPQNCVVLYRGESFMFRAIFSDNQALGNYNIEIHNNFNQHSHSTDNVECDLDEKKTPLNPFVYNQDFAIPDGLNNYEAENAIYIPAEIDEGDYHFMVRITDKSGWQELKAVSIKIKDKD